MELGAELREARLAAGLTIAVCAMAVGSSRQRWARVEQARIVSVALDDLHRMSAAVGLAMSVRCYPVGPALRDIGQLSVIGRLRRRLSPSWKVRLEAPVPIAGDRRAFDVLLQSGSLTIAIEVITRLRDVQAQLRSANLKWRDSGTTRLVMVIGSTHANRRALAGAGAALADDFPVEPAQLSPHSVKGRIPAATRSRWSRGERR